MSEATHLCTACFRSAATAPGDCPRCAVPRLPLANPEVRAELRRHAEEHLLRKRNIEITLTWVVAALPCAPLIFFLPLAYVLGPLLGLGLLLTFLYPRLVRGSAGATLAARRQRMSRELGRDTNLSSAPLLSDGALAANAGADPATMSPPELLASMKIPTA